MLISKVAGSGGRMACSDDSTARLGRRQDATQRCGGAVRSRLARWMQFPTTFARAYSRVGNHASTFFFAALLNFLMTRSRLSLERWSMNSTPLM